MWLIGVGAVYNGDDCLGLKPVNKSIQQTTAILDMGKMQMSASIMLTSVN